MKVYSHHCGNAVDLVQIDGEERWHCSRCGEIAKDTELVWTESKRDDEAETFAVYRARDGRLSCYKADRVAMMEAHGVKDETDEKLREFASYDDAIKYIKAQ